MSSPVVAPEIITRRGCKRIADVQDEAFPPEVKSHMVTTCFIDTLRACSQKAPKLAGGPAYLKKTATQFARPKGK